MQSHFLPEFVEFIPRELEEGVLYLSIAYLIAVHRCACGCGSKVVTPIGPTDWRFEYDGESVSLQPSIGNWQFPCRSHYWITANNVRWSRSWSDEEIRSGRASDIRAKERYFDRRATIQSQDFPKVGEGDPNVELRGSPIHQKLSRVVARVIGRRLH